jgi:hypothetical protein
MEKSKKWKNIILDRKDPKMFYRLFYGLSVGQQAIPACKSNEIDYVSLLCFRAFKASSICLLASHRELKIWITLPFLFTT